MDRWGYVNIIIEMDYPETRQISHNSTQCKLVMDNMDNERIRSSILGALVADAASVGFHWVYDQDRIRQIALEAPEFRAPTQNDYEGFPGFYAHGHKRAGELSYLEPYLALQKG